MTALRKQALPLQLQSTFLNKYLLLLQWAGGLLAEPARRETFLPALRRKHIQAKKMHVMKTGFYGNEISLAFVNPPT
jgi:hypothetical protein